MISFIYFKFLVVYDIFWVGLILRTVFKFNLVSFFDYLLSLLFNYLTVLEDEEIVLKKLSVFLKDFRSVINKLLFDCLIYFLESKYEEHIKFWTWFYF